jgi:hypothetical protein
MKHEILAALIGLSFAALARAGGDPKGEMPEGERAAYRAAFERCLTADVAGEWKAIAERKVSGAKAACEVSGHCGLECDCAPAGELLAYKLQANPAAWSVVAPLIEERFADEEVGGRALDVLAAARQSESAQKLAAQLCAADAKAFSSDQVLAFAEQGSEALKAEAFKRAGSDVRCAAFSAVQGEKRYARALAMAAEQKLVSDQSLLDAYAAAAGMMKLGYEEHWNRLEERVHDEVLRALDDGAIERARDLAVGAEFCAQGLSKGKGYGLAYLDSRLAFHRSVRSGELAEADQIFDLIENLPSR